MWNLNFILNIKIFFSIFSFITVNDLISDDYSFSFNTVGKITRNESIKFLSGSRFVSFKHEGGFNSSLAKYGQYSCAGSIFYNEKNALDDMTYACKFQDQSGNKFFTKGTRNKGSEFDRSTGKMTIKEGNGVWESYINVICIYGLEYVDDVVFVSVKCK